MEFIDCNACYGVDIATAALQPSESVGGLLGEMGRAGIAGAVVYRVEQHTAEPSLGNRLLAEDIAGHGNLYGLWAITPSHTHEMPGPAEVVRQMREKRIFGWRLCPGKLRFLPRAFVLRDWLELAVSRRIPLFVNLACGMTYEALADLLERYPALAIVLTDTNVWPNDRLLRPFVAEFPNVYLDLSYCTTERGIESFVGEYGAGRLLFGSGFPGSCFGANMLMLRHAGISGADREAIASGNMLGILGRVDL